MSHQRDELGLSLLPSGVTALVSSHERKMLYSRTNPESYITEYTLIYDPSSYINVYTRRQAFGVCVGGRDLQRQSLGSWVVGSEGSLPPPNPTGVPRS